MTAHASSTCTCEIPEYLSELTQTGDTCAVVLAGGEGKRFSSGMHDSSDDELKQFVDLCGRPLLSWSLLAFDEAPSVARIVVVCADKLCVRIENEILSREIFTTPVIFASAGDVRQDSSYSGVLSVASDLSIVAVHDGDRPLILSSMIEKLISQLRKNKDFAGAIPVEPIKDTLKQTNGDEVLQTLDRAIFRTVQTPQVFWTKKLLKAHRLARDTGFVGTDDASLLERLGMRVQTVENLANNLKVTYPEDLLCARAILAHRLTAGFNNGTSA